MAHVSAAGVQHEPHHDGGFIAPRPTMLEVHDEDGRVLQEVELRAPSSDQLRRNPTNAGRFKRSVTVPRDGYLVIRYTDMEEVR